MELLSLMGSWVRLMIAQDMQLLTIKFKDITWQLQIRKGITFNPVIHFYFKSAWQYQQYFVQSLLPLDELVRMAHSSCLVSSHRRKIDDEHDEVVNPNVVAIGVVPKGQNPLIHHYPLHHQAPKLGDHCRPDQMLIIGLRNHQSDEGQEEGDDGTFDFRLRNGVLTRRVVEVEAAECDSTSEEGQVVEIVVFVESVGAVHELDVVVIPLQHFVDEVEGRHAGKDEEERERPWSCFCQGFLHYRYLFVHHH